MLNVTIYDYFMNMNNKGKIKGFPNTFISKRNKIKSLLINSCFKKYIF